MNKTSSTLVKNGTCASPATALAIRVFPTPGGPTNKTPFGSFTPNFGTFRII